MKPCIYFRRGFCRKGVYCRFAHVHTAASDGQTPPFHHRQSFSPKRESDGLSSLRQWDFRIMSYNILADQYAYEHRRELYSSVPNFALNWARRKSMIVKEVEEWKPDLVCFQEVDHYDDLAHAMHQHGYRGVYTQRTGDRPDGLATFWKHNVFKLVERQQIMYTQLGLKDNVSQLFVLEFRHHGHKATSTSYEDIVAADTGNTDTNTISGGKRTFSRPNLKQHIVFEESDDEQQNGASVSNDGVAKPMQGVEAAAAGVDYSAIPSTSKTTNKGTFAVDHSPRPALVVGNIHVLFNPKRGDIKLAQVRTLLDAAHDLSIKHGSSHPVVVCGDFNSATDSPLYNFVVDGQLDLSTVQRKSISGQVEAQGRTGWPSLRQTFMSALAHHERNNRQQPPNSPTNRHQVGLETAALADAGAQMAATCGSPAFNPYLRSDAATQQLIQPSYLTVNTPNANWVDGYKSSSSTSLNNSDNRKGNKQPKGWTTEEVSLVRGQPVANLEGTSMVVQHPLKLLSAYGATLGQEPHYSTVHDKYVGNVDYVFFTPNPPAAELTPENNFVLEPVAVLQPPSLRTLHSGLPSNAWPSDHISLVTNFILRE